MKHNNNELIFDPQLNYLKVRDKYLIPPFECNDLYNLLSKLGEKLQDLNLCILDLHYFPYEIFTKSPLSYNPGCAKWIYHLIETWVEETEFTIHQGQKQRMFDNFLRECEKRADESIFTSEQAISQYIKKDIFYESYFSQTFVKTLIAICEEVTNDQKTIKTLVDGLALLPSYWSSRDQGIYQEFVRLSQPAFELITRSIKRAQMFEEYLNEEYIHKNTFVINGYKYPINKDLLLDAIAEIQDVIPRHPIDNQIIVEWFRFIYSCTKSYIPYSDLKSHVVNLDIEIQNIANSENKFWLKLPMNIVVKHFEILTTKLNKQKQPFLSNEQLISFLKKGFLNDSTQPIQKINCSNGEKGFVIKRFYEFYNLAVSKYWHPSGKDDFINLLGDCFDNWDKKSIKNFFKPGRTDKEW